VAEAKSAGARARDHLSVRFHGGSKVYTLPDRLPAFKLRHGQVLWLLNELGYGSGVSASAFYEYIKSLRKLGIPFGHTKFQNKRGKRLADYSYYHLMEIMLTLSLRVYHVVPDSVLKEIIRYRTHLCRFYRRAYAQRLTGAGESIVIRANGCKPITLRGLFLDLNIAFVGGHLVRFGPPRLLSPAKALEQFTRRGASAAVFTPMNLSLLSEQVVTLALQAPHIHSGPRKSRPSTAR